MKPARIDHDVCLTCLREHSSRMSDHERTALNIVAGAYACNEHVSRTQYLDAQKVLLRFAIHSRAWSSTSYAVNDNAVNRVTKALG